MNALIAGVIPGLVKAVGYAHIAVAPAVDPYSSTILSYRYACEY